MGMVVVSVDGYVNLLLWDCLSRNEYSDWMFSRGTGGRSNSFMTQTYLNLGYRETQDQIDAARYLVDVCSGVECCVQRT